MVLAQHRLTILMALTLIWPIALAPMPARGAQSDDLDCTAFASIDEANDYYLENPEAEIAIDDDGDGDACEVYFGLEERDPNEQSPATDQTSEPAQTAEDNLDCEDFTYQEESQAVLDADPNDPNNLDPNEDGIACALLPSSTEDVANGEGEVELAQTAEDERAQREAEREARRAARQAEEEGAAQTEDIFALTCADFPTQEEAQVAFDEDPEGMAALDEDGNGIACEELVVEDTTEPPQDETREERRNRRNNDQQVEETPDTVIDEPRRGAVREDLDCIDFQFQEEAQAMFDQDPSDPFNLDPNGDRFACSSLPLANPLVTQVPRTGTGASLPPYASLLAVVSVLVGIAGVAVGRRKSALLTRSAGRMFVLNTLKR